MLGRIMRWLGYTVYFIVGEFRFPILGITFDHRQRFFLPGPGTRQAQLGF